MKKYFHCILIFIALYIIVTLLTNFGMRKVEKDLNYFVSENDNFEIIVEEAKANQTNGYINLNVTNKTDKLLENNYLKIDLYNDNGYLVSKYKKIKYLNVGETNKFNINFNNPNVNKLDISVVEDMPETIQEDNVIKKISKSALGVNPEITDETIQIALPIAVAMGLMLIVP